MAAPTGTTGVLLPPPDPESVPTTTGGVCVNTVTSPFASVLELVPTPPGQGTVMVAGEHVAAHVGLVMVTVPSRPVAVAATEPVPATTSVGDVPGPAVPGGVAIVTVPSLPVAVTGAVIAVPGMRRVGGG